jgi:hypothetical protein
MQPRKKVKVEACYAHDGIVGIFLVWNKDIGSSIPGENETIVVRGDNGFEEFRGSSEERNVLNVGVVFLILLVQKLQNHLPWIGTYRMVGNEMMYVVTAFPPAD